MTLKQLIPTTLHFWLPLSAALLGLPRLTNAESPRSVEAKLSRLREQVNSHQLTERRLMATIHQLKGRVRQISERRSHLSDRVLSAKADVEQQARILIDLERKIEAEKRQTSQRLSGLHRLTGPASLQAFLVAGTPAERERHIRFLRLITERDLTALRDYQRMANERRLAKAKLEAKVRNLVSLKERRRSQEESLENLQREQIQLVAKLRRRSESARRELVQLRRRAGGTTDDLHFFERKGALGNPVLAPVKTGFGLIYNRQYQYRLAQKGLFFAVPQGSPVRSVARGRVVFAGELPRYGKIVMIDHDDSYFTVYGDLAESHVTVGETVTNDQLVGTTGYRPEERQSGLYFEIRHFSEALDPEAWLARSRTVTQFDQRSHSL